jgi:hypothetical protein
VRALPVDDAEVDRLGAAPVAGRDRIDRHAEDARSSRRVEVLAARERLDEPLVAGEVREDAQLDLRVVGSHHEVAGPGGTNAALMRRPRSVRTGMFCRFGLLLDRRPVAATVWLNVVCSRPSSPMRRGSASSRWR